MTYKIPTAVDMPTIKSILVESNDPDGPYGAKSVGEPALVPVAAAIANAVRNALGVPITDLPMTPDRVLAAVRSGSSET